MTQLGLTNAATGAERNGPVNSMNGGICMAMAAVIDKGLEFLPLRCPQNLLPFGLEFDSFSRKVACVKWMIFMDQLLLEGFL